MAVVWLVVVVVLVIVVVVAAVVVGGGGGGGGGGDGINSEDDDVRARITQLTHLTKHNSLVRSIMWTMTIMIAMKVW